MICHPGPETSHLLRLRRMGVDTYQEPIIYMRRDCHVCRSEGFVALTRVEVRRGERAIVATLNVVTGDLLSRGEVGLSEAAWHRLEAADGDPVTLSHPAPLESLRHLRARVFGTRFDADALHAIVGDVAAGRYSDIEIAAFLVAGAGSQLDRDEVIGLTRAMIDAGERLTWGSAPILDKHCVGGLPGNRTTMVLVPIVAALGVTIPKTSSRAITSPAGTADAMETVAPVDLDLAAMRRVVEREGGCIVWGGGAVRLSPADDVLIRVARPLDIDSEGQLIASILSKKVAAGSTHVVIDIPVGATAKVRDAGAARTLAAGLAEVGRALGLEVCVAVSDGTQPVGRGIGPALEARDVLAVLRGEPGAPPDLRDRALALAGQVLELAGKAPAGAGRSLAADALADGRAWLRFQAICEAQGGMRAPPLAAFTHPVAAARAGRVTAIDNRRLGRVAKLAGAPKAPAAGLELHAPLGAAVGAGEPLFTVHAETAGELAYALAYVEAQPEIVRVEEEEGARCPC